MVLATNLGFPRLGAQRELKWAIERYWSGNSSQADVEKTCPYRKFHPTEEGKKRKRQAIGNDLRWALKLLCSHCWVHELGAA